MANQPKSQPSENTELAPKTEAKPSALEVIRQEIRPEGTKTDFDKGVTTWRGKQKVQTF